MVEVETVPDPPPPEALSVVPSKVRFVPMESDFIAEVPLPTRIPPRDVEEAVPPLAIPSADASVSAPAEEKLEVAVEPKYAGP